MSTRFYLVLIVLLAPVLTAQDCDRGGKCERRAAFRVNFCFEALADLTRDCYLNTGQPCDPADFDGPLTYVRDVEGACEGSTPQVVGYGAQVHGPDLANRLEEECTGQVASLVARTFGGPHASVLNDAIAGGNTADQACLVAAFDEGAALTASVFDARRLCAQSPELNDVPCDLATTQIDIALAESAAVALIDAGCAGSDLESLIGIDSQEFASRAVTQADCMTSAGIGDTWPLPTTTCGPATIGPNIPIPARATPTQIVLDESVWGTRCGDGSPYAFWIDLAPAGSPVENVVVHMKGGGVCLFNDDCLNKLVNSPDLFSAVDDGFPSGGIFNTDPAVNPFANWTKVSLPYCTQDVFAGMGETEVFPSITVHRYGAVNVRAALQYVRNIIWAEANATSPKAIART